MIVFFKFNFFFENFSIKYTFTLSVYVYVLYEYIICSGESFQEIGIITNRQK